MPASLRDRLVYAWALLVGVTLLSIEIGVSGSAGGVDARAAASFAVLAIAFAKVGIVMFQFMEVRGAPIALRVACVAWLAVALASLLAAYSGLFGSTIN